MKRTKYLCASVMAFVAVTLLPSCSDDDFTESIFPTDVEDLDPTSYSYKFDKWLKQNFLDPYNLEFCYKMEDVETDMNYNLVPATYSNSQDIALLTKYLWFDAYDELTGKEFLKANAPRKIHIIGSPAYNASTGTEILGLAEGGIKVSLFKVNSMEVNNFYQLNEYYFRTMHHEFAHILHQKKSYPTEFNQLNVGNYDDDNWQDRNGGLVASLGFVTPYASSQFREDFAETIANYITRTPEQYDLILWCASQGWYSGDDELNQSTANCMYYYSSDEARESDTRSYTLLFQEAYALELNAEGELVLNRKIGVKDSITGRFLTSVEEIESWMEECKNEGYSLFSVEDTDKKDGKDIILQKVNIARNWLADSWGIDLDKLRDIVQARQNTLEYSNTIVELRKQIDAVQ
ncbi:MAG: putative zinc-binding metallopeptidase [Muribaculum sp.]|nr:putative zinc-binding metallopeptidase [Muribaculum sp.]